MMARNSLAHGQRWKTRNGMVITLGSAERVSRQEGYAKREEHEWFMSDQGYVYCNVSLNGRYVFGEDQLHDQDLMEQVE